MTSWQATMELRHLITQTLVHKRDERGVIPYSQAYILQQRWQSGDGKSEWRDVPKVRFKDAYPPKDENVQKT